MRTHARHGLPRPNGAPSLRAFTLLALVVTILVTSTAVASLGGASGAERSSGDWHHGLDGIAGLESLAGAAEYRGVRGSPMTPTRETNYVLFVDGQATRAESGFDTTFLVVDGCFTFFPAPPGTHTATIRARARAGNLSAPSNAITVEVP